MPGDLELLQGIWTVTALEADGQETPATMLANARIVIQRDRFTSTGMGADYEGTVKLSTSTKPRQIDMKFDAGPEKGNTNLGIYKLDGDTLKICLATSGTVRPSRFKSTSGSGFAVGSSSVNVLPFPGFESMVMSPRCSRANCRDR